MFLEIGPGTGALTRPLASRVKEIVAVEIDRDLAADLSRSAPPNVSILTGNFLEIDAEALVRDSAPGEGLRVAGNLPYNVSSPILFRLIDLHQRTRLLRDATIMLQREVVARLTAAPGSRNYGVLTILLRVHADVESVLSLPPGAFRPPPEVSSAVARVRFREPGIRVGDPRRFERLVKTVFTQRRKTLSNALKPLAPRGESTALLRQAGIDPRRRPETLDLAELAAIADRLDSE